MKHDDDIEKLARLIKGIRCAMLTTVDQDGTLRSRPMETQNTDFDGALWFFTDAGAPKVDEINREHEVNLAYADPHGNRYVSVSGTALVVRDKAKVDELWTPALKAWFPNGKDDPNIALLRVQVTKAEYWDAPSSTLVKLLGFTKAILTGKRYEPGDHEKLDVRPHA